MSSTTSTFEPIAIIGMGMRLPGSVRDAESFWELLSSGGSGHGPVPASRFDSRTWHSPRGRINHVATQHGYFLDEKDVDIKRSIDIGFWALGPQEARNLDPGARVLLEVVYEALETAGATAWRGSDTGVYVGTMGADWTALEALDGQGQHAVRADVYGDYILANRTSYEFDFRGPSVVVRTACSSSLVALHQACQDLQNGTCSAAVVAGVNIILSPRETAVMSAQGVLSPSGKCRTFDADADGYGRGEGVSAVYVKRLADALRDGDPVRSVIRSAVVGNDGAGGGPGGGMLTPDPRAHERLMRMAYRVAGIAEGEVQRTAMVECHGTGTSVGDPLETSAVANIWGNSGGIYIGSVKPKIGHGEGSSGISSLIKMTLALENATIPSNINFRTPNPAIPFESKKLIVPTRPILWPEDRAERVSINSFGIGGTNAHLAPQVILESAACAGVTPLPRSSGSTHSKAEISSTRMRLLPFSTKRQDSLDKVAGNIHGYLARHPTRLDDVAYTLAARRTIHPWRTYRIVGPDSITPSAVSATCVSPNGREPQVCWVFTGQGAQWAQMGKDLIEQEPLVSKCIDHLDDVLRELPDPPLWTIREEITKPKETSRLYEAEISQPCLAAIQIAIVDLLRSWGSLPAAIVGHSSGETAAAYAAGAITAEQAIVLNYHRGQITPAIKAAHNGSMAAVGLSRDDVQLFLRPGVIIGCENSPANVTLSGDADVLRNVMTDIQKAHPDTLVRQLRVECGFHSEHMRTAVPDFAARISEVARTTLKPSVPFYSSVSGELQEDLAASYWTSNLANPVLFNQAAQSLLRDIDNPIFVEIGPHSALAGPVRQILQKYNKSSSAAVQYIPTLVRGQNGHVNLLESAGRLWQQGIDIDLGAANNMLRQEPGRVLTDLPAYPWHHDAEYWNESRLTREWRFRRFAHHELLGLRVADCGDAVPTWRNVLSVSDVDWLADHRVNGDVWFPGAGFIAMVGEAVRQLMNGSSAYSVKDVVFENALMLANDDPVEIITSLVRIRESVGGRRQAQSAAAAQVGMTPYAFTISSIADDGTATEHVHGECCAGRWDDDGDHAAGNLTTTRADGILADDSHLQMQVLPRKVSPAAFYKLWSKHGGLQYGPQFRGCMADVSAHVTERKAQATITRVQSHDDVSLEGSPNLTDGDLYALHPTVIDTSTVLCMIAECCGLPRKFTGTGIPAFIGTMYISGQQRESVRVEAQVLDNGTSCITGVDAEGRMVLELTGFRVEKTAPRSQSGDNNPHGGAVIEWMPDVDFMDCQGLSGLLLAKATKLTQLLDQLATACCRLLERKQTETVQLSQQELGLLEYKAWLDVTIRSFEDFDNVEDAKQSSDNSSWFEAETANAADMMAIRGLASKICTEYRGTTEAALAARMLDTVLDHSDSDATSDSSLETSSPTRATNIVWNLIDEMTFPSDLIDVLAFKNPQLRILDVCIGGSHAARTGPPAYLASLHQAGRLHGTYVHTYTAASGISELDLSGEAAPLTATTNGIAFKSVQVDLDLHLTEQGFAAQSFDLVLLTELSPDTRVLPYLGSTKLLVDIRKVLDVDGHLVVRELDSRSPVVQALLLQERYVQPQPHETLPAATLSPVDRELRRQSLLAAGFGDFADTMPPAGHIAAGGMISSCTSTIARPRGQPDPEKQGKGGLPSSAMPELRVLCRNSRSKGLEHALHELRAEGFSDIEVIALGAPIAVDGQVNRLALCLLDLDGPFLHSASEAEFEGLKHSLSLSLVPEAVCEEQKRSTDQSTQNRSNSDGSRSILWVTGASQMHCTSDPNYALTLGFTRGLHRETGDDIITLEVESFDLDDGGNSHSNHGEKAGNSAPKRSTWNAVADLLRAISSRTHKAQIREQNSLLPLEREYVFSNGLLHISRFKELKIATELDAMRHFANAPGAKVRSQQYTSLLRTGTTADFKVHPDRTYILVGGLGGLGQTTARFLADRGARYFVFFSRSAEDFGRRNPDFVAEMRGYEGCVVTFVSGDIARVEDVERMAAVLTSSPPSPVLSEIRWPPFGGVFNAAMVLADTMLSDMSFTQWQAAVAPKVEGTWNLHRVLFASCLRGRGADGPQHEQKVARSDQQNRSATLDMDHHPPPPTVDVAPGAFLFLFSSLSGVSHMLGQANYAAANSFLDAFAQYHTHATSGFSAGAVLDIGAMEDVGVLAREGDRLDRFRGQQWIRLLSEREFLEALEVVLGRQQSSSSSSSSSASYPREDRLGQGYGSESAASELSDDDQVITQHDTAPHEDTIRGYVSPAQIIIGLGSPPSTMHGTTTAGTAMATASATPGSARTGVAWDKDARFAFHAAAAATAVANHNTMMHGEHHHTHGTALDTQNLGNHDNGNRNKKSHREEAVRCFLARVRSADGPDAAQYLATPSATSFLVRVVRDAIAELRGVSDDAAGTVNDSGLDDDVYQSMIDGETSAMGPQQSSPPSISGAESLADLGVDSLVTVELRTWIRQKLGANLSVAEMRRAGGGGLQALAVAVARKLAAAAGG
ncbi:beta-ketoacyl synthase [Microdochium bolleyi]|uniref:Beta-ketoacyl synthase n=1 Tax=Microdochium bolleyi TaxID=196109 RepID=A0A136JD11_9PEZI|nr:beta-ketoacyl synthase [Microdochium bolleyi]